MSATSLRRRLVVLTLLAAVATLAACAGTTNFSALIASARYGQERSELAADLSSAQARGYTADDLRPITDGLRSVEDQGALTVLAGGGQLEERRTARLAQLDVQLKAREAELVDEARTKAAVQLGGIRASFEQARVLGAADHDLAPLHERLDALAQAEAGARELLELRADLQAGGELANELDRLNASQQEENQAVAQSAQALAARGQSDLGAVRKEGTDALATARNDASVAAYLNKPAAFKGYSTLLGLVQKLERYGAQIGSADPGQATRGAAGTLVLAGRIHAALLNGLPFRAILISYADQHLWAYENGKVVEETPVTTGRPQLPTDLGPMKVLGKDSPWVMHSPWPQGSPYWYPDTKVKMVVWFSRTGEGLHDADWQSCCWGPGSQYSAKASHGCVHVPDAAESFIYRWSVPGTPVVVFQGDGSPVADQVARITTDDDGNPRTGPKGI